MTLSLRRRLLLALVPLLALPAALGGAGVVLLDRVGGGIDAILRENYDSVRAMFRLNEALERIDSSFQFALAGREEDARRAYADNWPACRDQLAVEERNVTLPGEAELLNRLKRLTDEYQAAGDRFYARPAADPARRADYFGSPESPGLLGLFRQLKGVTGAILRINQENMEEANHEAKAAAGRALATFGAGLTAAAVLAAWFAWWLARGVLRPIRAVTRAAQAIGAGQLHQTVPVFGRDEVGQLAQAFNAMSLHLRDYRQSNTAQLLRAQRTGQATIDSFPDPVLVVDPTGCVELANPAARRLFGVAPPPDGDAEPVAWQPPEPLRQPLRDALAEQRPFLTEAFGQAATFRLDGEERAYLPQVWPIRDPYGGTLGAAVVLNDVTRFRLLDQFKTDLVATVSHELKTPLTSLRLALHLLLEETVGPLTPKQTELLLDARDNAERLLSLIEHLLALARLEHAGSALHLSPQSPAALLQTAADRAAPRAADKHVTLAVEAGDELPAVAADAERLGHALNNLVDNALTYTEAGGRVTLAADRPDAGHVRLTVADTGAGIPKEHLPHVFDKFFRVPGQSHPPGTGLGLAIVREVVEAHGGAVTCESEPGRGTAFHVTLPVEGGEP
jgi:signal transduction histidine kinase